MDWKNSVISEDQLEPNKETLERCLRPIYLATYYTGILQDWCRPNSQQSCSIFIHTCCTLTATAAVLFLFVFEIVQFCLELFNSRSVSEITYNLAWICVFPLALGVLFRYNFYRKDFLAFFSEFAKLECDLLPVKSPVLKLSYWMIFSFAMLGVSLLFGLSFNSMKNPDASYLLSHYQILRDTFTAPGLAVFQMSLVIVSWLLLSLADLVPGLVFVHLGLALKSLILEVENCKLSVSEIRTVWLRYESIGRLTEKANRLFGWLIFFDYAVKFSMICVLLYCVLCLLFELDLFFWTVLLGTCSFTFRLVSCNLLASELHSSFHQFKSTLSTVFSLKCCSMSKEEREFVTLFLNRLLHNQLAARPLNLINIVPNNLLTMASLIISYVIILLQSR